MQIKSSLLLIIRSLIGLKQVLSFDEACIYLNIGKSRLYQATSNSEIPHYKRFGKVYFKREDLDQVLTEDRVISQKEAEVY